MEEDLTIKDNGNQVVLDFSDLRLKILVMAYVKHAAEIWRHEKARR